METYYWSTEQAHATNGITMSDFINNHMNPHWEVMFCQESHAEIVVNNVPYEVHASGNGDFFNHKVEFKVLQGV